MIQALPATAAFRAPCSGTHRTIVTQMDPARTRSRSRIQFPAVLVLPVALWLAAHGCDGTTAAIADSAWPACRDPAGPDCLRCVAQGLSQLARDRWAACQASPACRAAVEALPCCLERAGSDLDARRSCINDLGGAGAEGFNLSYSFPDFCPFECRWTPGFVYCGDRTCYRAGGEVCCAGTCGSMDACPSGARCDGPEDCMGRPCCGEEPASCGTGTDCGALVQHCHADRDCPPGSICCGAAPVGGRSGRCAPGACP